MDSELEFEDFFQSSVDGGDDGGLCSTLGSDQLEGDEEWMSGTVFGGGEDDSPGIFGSSCVGSQGHHDFYSDSLQFSSYVSSMNEDDADCHGMDEEPPAEDVVEDEGCRRYRQSSGAGESLHLSCMRLDGGDVVGEDENDSNSVFSGFTTGNNKKIEVRRESIRLACRALDAGPVDTGDIEVYRSQMPQTQGAEYGSSGEGLRSCELESVYSEVRRRFPKDDERWVFGQFKWTWLYFFLEGTVSSSDDLVERIEEQMRVRRRCEYSVLRRIVEGDDVPWRYMILLVVGVTEEWIEVFDGSYSLYALYDRTLGERIRRGGIHVGCRLRVFGSELLVESPTSIFDVTGASLRLHSNGVQTVRCVRRLGYRKKIGFMCRIAGIVRDGGPVSCIQGTVTRVVETKYLVRVEGYSHTTDDLECELDKIEELARRAQRKIRREDLSVRTYVKFVLRDESEECVVMWWDPHDEVKVSQMLRMTYLLPTTRCGDFYLSTSRRTCVRFLG